jgi:hypothetical protein
MAVATPAVDARRTPSSPSKPRLKPPMGLWMATAPVVGNMVGSAETPSEEWAIRRMDEQEERSVPVGLGLE